MNDKTVDYYDKKAKSWQNSHSGITSRDKEILTFESFLPRGKVLEIGSGIGDDARNLINHGYDYVGIDASEELLKVAQSKNPEGKFIRMNFYELNFDDNSFDGFWSAATLLHVRKEKIEQVLAKINKLLKTDGVGFISMMEGSGEKEDPNTGRWFSYYSKKEFIEILNKTGFEIVQINKSKDEKYSFLQFYVKKTH